jgi:dihydroorotate dehydrogenase (fumarate)
MCPVRQTVPVTAATRMLGIDHPIILAPLGGGPSTVDLNVSLAASTGVEDPADVTSCLLAGADVVMTTSALLRHGVDHAEVLLQGLRAWMARKGFTRISEFRGMLAVPLDVSETTTERANYVDAMREANASAHGPY